MLQRTRQPEGNVTKPRLRGVEAQAQLTHPGAPGAQVSHPLSPHCLTSPFMHMPSNTKRLWWWGTCCREENQLLPSTFGNLESLCLKWCSDGECTVSTKQGVGTRQMQDSRSLQHWPMSGPWATPATGEPASWGICQLSGISLDFHIAHLSLSWLLGRPLLAQVSPQGHVVYRGKAGFFLGQLERLEQDQNKFVWYPLRNPNRALTRIFHFFSTTTGDDSI